MKRVALIIAIGMIFSLCSCKITIDKDNEGSATDSEMADAGQESDENSSIEYDSGNHLSFKGIPINGNIQLFSKRLKAKGFKSIGSTDGIPFYSGKFTDTEVNVGVISTDEGKNVYGVVVLFPASEEWKELTGTYNYYKELYTSKYGTPKTSTETNPALYDDNLFLMAELRSGTVKYISCWNAKGGSIELSIENSGDYLKGLVVIRYRDDINLENKRKSDLNEI